MMIFPGGIRPQALIFARFPRTLRPPAPDLNPAPGVHFCKPPVHPQNPAPGARFGTLPVRHPTPRSRLESGLKRSILHPSRAPCDSQLPTRIRPQALDCARLPRALRPQSRLQSGIKCSIWHPSRAPCDPQLPTRIRPRIFNFACIPRTLRPPDPA